MGASSCCAKKQDQGLSGENDDIENQISTENANKDKNNANFLETKDSQINDFKLNLDLNSLGANTASAKTMEINNDQTGLQQSQSNRNQEVKPGEESEKNNEIKVEINNDTLLKDDPKNEVKKLRNRRKAKIGEDGISEEGGENEDELAEEEDEVNIDGKEGSNKGKNNDKNNKNDPNDPNYNEQDSQNQSCVAFKEENKYEVYVTNEKNNNENAKTLRNSVNSFRDNIHTLTGSKTFNLDKSNSKKRSMAIQAHTMRKPHNFFKNSQIKEELYDNFDDGSDENDDIHVKKGKVNNYMIKISFDEENTKKNNFIEINAVNNNKNLILPIKYSGKIPFSTIKNDKKFAEVNSFVDLDSKKEIFNTLEQIIENNNIKIDEGKENQGNQNDNIKDSSQNKDNNEPELNKINLIFNYDPNNFDNFIVCPLQKLEYPSKDIINLYKKEIKRTQNLIEYVKEDINELNSNFKYPPGGTYFNLEISINENSDIIFSVIDSNPINKLIAKYETTLTLEEILEKHSFFKLYLDSINEENAKNQVKDDKSDTEKIIELLLDIKESRHLVLQKITSKKLILSKWRFKDEYDNDTEVQIQIQEIKLPKEKEKLIPEYQFTIKKYKEILSTLEEVYESEKNKYKIFQKYGLTPRIISNENQIYLLNYWITNNKSKVKYELYYSAKDDGDSSNQFHLLCDFISPSLILIKTDTNKVYGGYTTQSWKDVYFKMDSDAFLCDLDYHEKYPVNNNGANAIFCHRDFGPIFGKEHTLCITDKCTSSGGNYILKKAENSFEFPYHRKESKMEMFNCLELEVYRVMLNQQENNNQ